ncbi:hypothetical protein RJJ37_04055 [Rhizobium redzepovicii]|uniref:DUF1828 domain-containing protein n=1 Tax=Rhizobium redzepovicii TaxID=2867518 RepID=A0AAW8NV90_9HYPH|nr:hypothetical protein [Rhizobium redzepovicii]MDR9758813.1 hypothetical protein [Rhizobium redzepovicii]
MIDRISINAIAEEVSRALSYSKCGNDGAMVVTPLLYPGGSRVVLRFQESPEGYFISDLGAGRREADLMDGDTIFTKIAKAAAERFGVRFDSDMIFDIEVPREALVSAAISVANASKEAVDHTAARVSERRAMDQRDRLWSRLAAAFPGAYVAREIMVQGASSHWNFDAMIQVGEHQSLFDLVAPHPASVHAAVSKFLDVKDLGENSPVRVAVTVDKEHTPHLPLLGRTAKIIQLNSAVETFKLAA